MNVLICLFFLLVAALPVMINLYATYLLKTGKEEPATKTPHWPAVAVLIAARNEAHNLPRCLHALEQLNYPADKLSIWIGNDQSSDQTMQIARAWTSHQKNRHAIDIRENIGKARGKANVLAQLARHAASEADFYFITDADMVVNPAWIKQMLLYFRPGIGIVNGTSVVAEGGAGKGINARMQRFDWALGLGLAKAYTYFPYIGETLTAIGNNMAVRRQAYEAIGGYENIPFSVTEDYELHRQLKRIGYGSLQVACPEVKAFTQPAKNWKELLHQRKRWMRGAMQLPPGMVAILFIQALFFPAILVALFCYPFWAVGILLAKLLSQTFLIRSMLQRVEEPPAFPFAGFEVYSLLLNMSLIFFYFMPLPLHWKGRTY